MLQNKQPLTSDLKFAIFDGTNSTTFYESVVRFCKSKKYNTVARLLEGQTLVFNGTDDASTELYANKSVEIKVLLDTVKDLEAQKKLLIRAHTKQFEVNRQSWQVAPDASHTSVVDDD